MGLESATYIHELNANNPVGASDPRAQGDDHIRMIKDTIQNTFPNVAGEVTPTHTELNYLDGATGVTGTGNTVRSAAPTFTGTVVADTLNASGDLQIDGISLKSIEASAQGAGAYSLVAGDNGRILNVTTAGTQTLGDQIEGFTAIIMNSSAGSFTITPGDGTLSYMAGSGSAPSTGNRTLARGGVCTVTRIAEDDWRIFGVGLS